MRFKLLVSLLLFSSFAFAIEVQLPLEKLAQESDRVFRGRVTNLSYRAGTNEFGDQLIYTDVAIRVFEALKGERSDLVLTVEGGTLKGITLAVSDTAEFKVGEDVLVFAKKDLLHYRPSAGSQAKYTISRDGMVLEKKVRYTTFRRTVLEAIHRKGGEK